MEQYKEDNCPYQKVGERVPNLNIDDSQEQWREARGKRRRKKK